MAAQIVKYFSYFDHCGLIKVPKSLPSSVINSFWTERCWSSTIKSLLGPRMPSVFFSCFYGFTKAKSFFWCHIRILMNTAQLLCSIITDILLWSFSIHTAIKIFSGSFHLALHEFLYILLSFKLLDMALQISQHVNLFRAKMSKPQGWFSQTMLINFTSQAMALWISPNLAYTTKSSWINTLLYHVRSVCTEQGDALWIWIWLYIYIYLRGHLFRASFL